jgi:biopolymer transport protein ExbD
MVARAESRFVSPLAVPGPRLLCHTALRFVRLRARPKRRVLGFELPLVSLIDCFLCLVLFLLGSFTPTTECLDLRQLLPRADNTQPMTDAPVVVVTPFQISVDGVPAGDVAALLDAGRLTRLDELFTVLHNKRELWRMLNPEREFPGTVVLEVDRSVPSLAVKSAFQTAAFAGYPNISFMVQKR